MEAFTLYVGAIIAIDLIGHQDFTGEIDKSLFRFPASRVVSPPGASEDVLEAQALFQGGRAGLTDELALRLPLLWAYLLPNSKKLSSAKSKLYSTSKFSHSRELSGTSGCQQELIERSLLPARSWELYMFCEKTCQ